MMPLVLDRNDENHISVDGSLADMEQLAQLISDPQAAHPAQLFSNFELEVRDIVGNVIIRRSETGRMIIEGGQKAREILADNLRFLARQPERATGSKHIHIEYCGDDSYLDAASEPALFSLRP